MFGKKKEEIIKTEVIRAKSSEAKAQDQPAKSVEQEASEYFTDHYLGLIDKPFDAEGNMDREVMMLNIMYAIYCELYKKNR